jgi:hypothetical protein
MTLAWVYPECHIAVESLDTRSVTMSAGLESAKEPGQMTLMEAARLMERLQGRAAHSGELEALRIARDALLTLIGDGYCTLADRLGARNGRHAPSPGKTRQ